MTRRRCSDRCGKLVTNYSQECYPVAPWDTPGLPPRTMEQRCAQHACCAYRDDDPAYCWSCHAAYRSALCPKCLALEADRPVAQLGVYTFNQEAAQLTVMITEGVE
jgi:hypothetical protein